MSVKQSGSVRNIQLGSTLYFESIKQYRKASSGSAILDGQLYDTPDNAYGILGNPTMQSLAAKISELEQADRTFIYPSGTSANSHTMNALTKSGDTVFIPDACYGPIRHFANSVLPRNGVNVEYYNPQDLDDLDSRVTDTTSLIFAESPISNTFEVVDLERIKNIAKKVGAFSAIDAAWSSGILAKFIPFGFDVSVIVPTKYIGGYSDTLMGCASSSNPEAIKLLETNHHAFGVFTSSFEITLVERGLESVSARMKQASESAAEIVKVFENNDKIMKIYQPSRNKDFSKYFEKESCLFSIELTKVYSDEELQPMFDQFKVFKIGESWGGTHSLVLPYLMSSFDSRTVKPKNTLIRFNIGLEPLDELIGDVRRALEHLS